MACARLRRANRLSWAALRSSTTPRSDRGSARALETPPTLRQRPLDLLRQAPFHPPFGHRGDSARGSIEPRRAVLLPGPTRRAGEAAPDSTRRVVPAFEAARIDGRRAERLDLGENALSLEASDRNAGADRHGEPEGRSPDPESVADRHPTSDRSAEDWRARFRG